MKKKEQNMSNGMEWNEREKKKNQTRFEFVDEEKRNVSRNEMSRTTKRKPPTSTENIVNRRHFWE